MKKYNRIFKIILLIIAAVFAAANIAVLSYRKTGGREYRVEISRLAGQMAETGTVPADLTGCRYVTGIHKFDPENTDSDRDYMVKEVNGELYRFEYKAGETSAAWIYLIVNGSIGILALTVILVMLYIRKNVLKPFMDFSGVPLALSRGELTAPVEDSRNPYFGKFIWGVNMLRETMEDRNKREMELQKEKKMLVLSLSHDIKTPLSAIKLYAQALSRDLYRDEEKKKEIAGCISSKADEMEGYLAQIITASREDFLDLTVEMSEFYLADLMKFTEACYREKLLLVGTEFEIGKYQNCILKGDFNRSVEVIQNIVENALKYGDGRCIRFSFKEEDGCVLITVADSGDEFSNEDTPYMFESFWRGENARNKKGSGLGLYICRQLMMKMNGDIFAEYADGFMKVTAVFGKAG